MSVGRITADGRLCGAKRDEFVAARDGGWFCHYCGQSLANTHRGERPSCRFTWQGHLHPNGLCHAELDHVVPRGRGGSNLVGNLVLACGPCNQAKGVLSYEEFTGRQRAAS